MSDRCFNIYQRFEVLDGHATSETGIDEIKKDRIEIARVLLDAGAGLEWSPGKQQRLPVQDHPHVQEASTTVDSRGRGARLRSLASRLQWSRPAQTSARATHGEAIDPSLEAHLNWSKDMLPSSLEIMQELVRHSLRGGGPEVLEMLSEILPRPRTLMLECRLVIRDHLSRPILLAGNVDKLPLPVAAKRYISMEGNES